MSLAVKIMYLLWNLDGVSSFYHESNWKWLKGYLFCLVVWIPIDLPECKNNFDLPIFYTDITYRSKWDAYSTFQSSRVLLVYKIMNTHNRRLLNIPRSHIDPWYVWFVCRGTVSCAMEVNLSCLLWFPLNTWRIFCLPISVPSDALLSWYWCDPSCCFCAEMV